MASTSETGHAKNVANLDTLIAAVTGYGTAYNPSKAAIKLTALQTLATSAKTTMTNVNTAMPTLSNAVAVREVGFAPLSKLITRVGSALKATDVTPQVMDSATTIIRKIQGKRATPKMTEEEKKEVATATGKEVVQVSSSQLSYDNRLENLDKLIKLLTSITLYAPNEAELKVTALTTLYNDLKTKNAAVVSANVPLTNARIARNDALYKKNTGLVDIAMETKTYIKSLYGPTSPQYKMISKLTFKSVS